ncbi:phosphoribosyltransferase [Streptomyces sp. MS06]|uniref:phosphoribosyltransferase n=1 Tax=Streptomyces sp. MS06 TaxID=3385974 RepID=UPI0039A27F72
MRFRDRRQAGRELAERLSALSLEGGLHRPVVLALPRGGAAVGLEVARALRAPLDVLVARKIGAPFEEEFGVGAVAGDEPPLFDETSLAMLGLDEADLAPAVDRERAELHRREELYRQGRPALDLSGRTAVVVDDGVATGSTARAAVRSLRRRTPRRTVLAVPVAAPQAADLLRPEVDELVCLYLPGDFRAVGGYYADFEQLTDEDVLRALSAAPQRRE